MMKQMHIFLVGVLLLCSQALSAQAPQSFSYQAVATDSEGSELEEQAIGVRFSVLEEGGTVLWRETHSSTTDPFGLFTLSVGAGTPDGGSAPSFDQINWGQGPYFLQVELDVDGGTDYQNLGTTQLRSVPFALFTEKASRADSATAALTAQVAAVADSSATSAYAQEAAHALNADNAVQATQSYLADYALFADSATSTQTAAFAQEAESANTAATADYALNADMASFAQAAFIELMDEDRDSLNELQELSFDGESLSLSNANTISLTEQSTYFSPGADFRFPEGLKGDSYFFIPDQYTVPPGKNFYIVAAEEEVRFPNIGNDFGMAKTSPHHPIVGANTLIDNCRCIGFLVDQSERIQPVVVVLAAEDGNAYTVPNDRHLIIKSGVDAATGLTLNNLAVNFFNGPTPFLVIPGGVTIRNPSAEEVIITGYLNQ